MTPGSLPGTGERVDRASGTRTPADWLRFSWPTEASAGFLSRRQRAGDLPALSVQRGRDLANATQRRWL